MGSMPAPELPALVPENHRWTASKTNPRLIQRRGIGSEAIVGLQRQNRRGQYDLYLLATLRTAETTSTTLSLAYLKEKFEFALLAARFEHPECANTASWDDEVAAIISYESPESHESALAWAKDCVHLRTTSMDGQQLRDEIEEKRTATNDRTPAKSIDIFLLADVPSEDAPIPGGTSIDVLIHNNHLFWDGISSRMFTGDLFRHLNDYIGTPAGEGRPKPQWGKEIKNLSPPILDSLKLDVTTLGDEFDQKCKEYTAALMENYGGRGLKFKPGIGVPRIDMLTLSVEDSKAIVKAVKKRLGPGYTISHLTQAAIVLAMLDVLKPTDLGDNETFVSPMPVNGRRWMQDDLAGSYYAICETGAVIRVENLKEILVGHHDDKDRQVQALLKACKDVKTSFDRWLKNPFQQALGLRVLTMEANYLQMNPMPFDKEAIPFFISDGINERFIPQDIRSSETSEIFFTVEKFNFLVNQLFPYLGIRLESWRDASTMAILYNEANYSPQQAKDFLKSITEFMLAFTL